MATQKSAPEPPAHEQPVPEAPAPRPPNPSLVERLHAQREIHEHRSMFKRVLLVVVGFLVVAAGCVMFITPGPALVVIPVGLAILSLEFTWAEKLLDRAIIAGEDAKRKAEEATTAQKIVSALMTVLVCAGIAVWAILGNIPIVPVL